MQFENSILPLDCYIRLNVNLVSVNPVLLEPGEYSLPHGCKFGHVGERLFDWISEDTRESDFQIHFGYRKNEQKGYNRVATM